MDSKLIELAEFYGIEVVESATGCFTIDNKDVERLANTKDVKDIFNIPFIDEEVKED